MSHTFDNIATPRGTRLETVWRIVQPDGTVRWQVWTACADRSAPIHAMRGTFLELHSDGAAIRITAHPDHDSVMEILSPSRR